MALPEVRRPAWPSGGQPAVAPTPTGGAHSVAFYRDGLGWQTEGIVGEEFYDEITGARGTIAFFPLDAGLKLGLYERADLARDASLPVGPPSSTEFSLGIPAASRAEVDELLAQVQTAGGRLTAPAHMPPFGVYSGFFTDPDGHLFEIAWNSSQYHGQAPAQPARRGKAPMRVTTLGVPSPRPTCTRCGMMTVCAEVLWSPSARAR